MPVQFSTLIFPVITLTTLMVFAAFDFYAFSPRPSGIVMRSRSLAPIVTVLLAVAAGAFALFTFDIVTTNGLIDAGANYAPKTRAYERLRLLTYPFVTTNPFEGLLLTLMLLASGFSLTSRFGLVGWSCVVTGVTLFVGAGAVVSDSSSLHFGSFELSLGLTAAVALLAFLDREPKPVPAAVSLAVAILLGTLGGSELRWELALIALLSGACIAAGLFLIRRASGPHWESTSLSFMATIACFVVAGFAVYFAPTGFNSEAWASQTKRIRAAIVSDVVESMIPFGRSPVDARADVALAAQFEWSSVRIRQLISLGEQFSAKEDAPDPRTLADLKTLEKILGILERLHRSKSVISDADRRTQAAFHRAASPGDTDALHDFWKNHLPWMDDELVSLRYSQLDPSPDMLRFIYAVNLDIERVTQAALDAELSRVDVWLAWAVRQPPSETPALRSVAGDQVAHLESLAVLAHLGPSQPDARLRSLEQGLRKIASAPRETSAPGAPNILRE